MIFDGNKPVVLVVDDEEFNLEIINDYLSEIDIETVCVDSGEKALSLLQNFPQKFSAVLLDWMMPGVSGIDVLLSIKADENINRLPVIMQTAKAGKEPMLEGLTAGAHYYISKPYDQKTLVAITSTAIRDYQHFTHMQDSLKKSAQTLRMMEHGVFCFQTLDEGRNLAALLANACPESDSVVLGLTELIINAVEHGNLSIGYDEKSKLNAVGEWDNEIERRLNSPINKNKYVKIEFIRSESEIMISILDQGDGFDWHQYMEISPSRAFDSHGRGIALANLISFKEIEYIGSGNKVCVTIPNGR